MQAIIDITGNTYNYLEVIGFSHIGKHRRSYWKCKCTRCGKEVILRKDSFAYPYSQVKSCGCWHIEESKLRAKQTRGKNGKFQKLQKKGNNYENR